MALPNLLIMGAPKCGTTALAEYLDAHPDACMSYVKETYYFLDPDYTLYRHDVPTYHKNGLIPYEKYFEHRGPQMPKIRFEATPHHMFQRTALEVIPYLSSSPILLFILRRPSEAVWSLFRFAQNNVAVLPMTMTFAEFVDRVRNQDQWLSDHDPHLAATLERVKYVNHILPYKSVCPPHRLRVYLAEDLRRDPRRFMKELAVHVGLDPGFYDAFPFKPVNETIHVRNQKVHGTVRMLKAMLPLSFGWRVIRRSRIKRIYRTLNTRPPKPPSAEDLAVQAELDELFAPYNQKLAEEMQIDISPWQ
jgi:hypothetical protein